MSAFWARTREIGWSYAVVGVEAVSVKSQVRGSNRLDTTAAGPGRPRSCQEPDFTSVAGVIVMQ